MLNVENVFNRFVEKKYEELEWYRSDPNSFHNFWTSFKKNKTSLYESFHTIKKVN